MPTRVVLLVHSYTPDQFKSNGQVRVLHAFSQQGHRENGLRRPSCVACHEAGIRIPCLFKRIGARKVPRTLPPFGCHKPITIAAAPGQTVRMVTKPSAPPSPGETMISYMKRMPASKIRPSVITLDRAKHVVVFGLLIEGNVGRPDETAGKLTTNGVTLRSADGARIANNIIYQQADWRVVLLALGPWLRPLRNVCGSALLAQSALVVSKADPGNRTQNLSFTKAVLYH